jgi:hypothetical protein
LAEVKIERWGELMTKTMVIDLLSDDADVRRNSAKALQAAQTRAAKHERMKRLVAEVSKKTLAASAGR